MERIISCRHLLDHELCLNKMIKNFDLTEVRNKERDFKGKVADLIIDYGNLKKT
jgi:hypothetical protein